MNKQNTEQLKMVIELSYEPKLMHGNEKEAMDWFFNYILKKDKLTLVSEEIGDFIGEVKVLELLTKTTPSHDEIKREAIKGFIRYMENEIMDGAELKSNPMNIVEEYLTQSKEGGTE